MAHFDMVTGDLI